jgi:hypothetical protein
LVAAEGVWQQLIAAAAAAANCFLYLSVSLACVLEL